MKLQELLTAMAQQQQQATAAPASRFRSQQQMIDAAGSEGLVCLHFAASKDKSNLYVHKSFLRCCSGVMKSLLDEESSLVSAPQQQQPSKVAKLQAGSSAAAAAAAAAKAADASLPVLPMPDEDVTAWEEALALMYPMPPGLQIGWDNAKRLLLLADKYDAPLIIERIRSFFIAKKETYLPTELERSLSPETAFDWLVTFSQCNIDDLAEVCLKYIKDNPSATLPAGFSSSRLQPKHLEQLCCGLQAKNALLQTSVNSLRSQLVAATYRFDAPEPYHGYFCRNCRTQWYTQPNGTTPAPHCIKCGIPKKRGL